MTGMHYTALETLMLPQLPVDDENNRITPLQILSVDKNYVTLSILRKLYKYYALPENGHDWTERFEGKNKGEDKTNIYVCVNAHDWTERFEGENNGENKTYIYVCVCARAHTHIRWRYRERACRMLAAPAIPH